MKLLLTFSFSLLLFCSFATIKTTVADGSWFDANNWSPAGVPLMEDTVVINHHLTVSGNFVEFGASWLIVNSNASIIGDTIFALHGNLRMLGNMNLTTIAIGDGDSTLVYGTVEGRKFLPTNPVNMNYGSILSDTLVAGDNFENFHVIDVLTFIAGGPTFVNHSGSGITASNMATFSSVTDNQAGAIVVTGTLITSENIVNNGDITCTNWTHGSGIANGVTGKYCVTMCFINNSTISGTIDICDATPSFLCDINMGTVAGTVTFCSASPCAQNLGIEEQKNAITIYPNPVINSFQIENGVIGTAYRIYSISGKIVVNGIISSSQEVVELEDLQQGVYFIETKNSTERVVLKFIKE